MAPAPSPWPPRPRFRSTRRPGRAAGSRGRPSAARRVPRSATALRVTGSPGHRRAVHFAGDVTRAGGRSTGASGDEAQVPAGWARGRAPRRLPVRGVPHLGRAVVGQSMTATDGSPPQRLHDGQSPPQPAGPRPSGRDTSGAPIAHGVATRLRARLRVPGGLRSRRSPSADAARGHEERARSATASAGYSDLVYCTRPSTRSASGLRPDIQLVEALRRPERRQLLQEAKPSDPGRGAHLALALGVAGLAGLSSMPWCAGELDRRRMQGEPPPLGVPSAPIRTLQGRQGTAVQLLEDADEPLEGVRHVRSRCDPPEPRVALST